MSGCFEAPSAPEAWVDAESASLSDVSEVTTDPDGETDDTITPTPTDATPSDTAQDGDGSEPTPDGSDPAADAVADVTMDDGAETPSLCPGPEPCDLHCFILVQWGDASTFKALMCKEKLGVLPESADDFVSSHCGDSLVTTTEESGGALGACPVTADLEPSGWKQMRQVAGCRVDYDDDASFTKWLYGLAVAEQDFKVGRGAPSQSDVELECAQLSQSGTDFATVIHCEPACDGGEDCPPELCVDSDHDTCSTRTCTVSAEATATLCGWSLDHTPCGDGKGCTDNACVAGAGCVDNPVHEKCEMPCKSGTCEGAQPGTDEHGCTFVDAAEGTSCDDDDPCTEGDTCLEGTCQAGEPMDCSSQDSDCTVGVCTNGICVGSLANAGDDCDDGVGCYDTHQCNGGACVGAGSELDCDDGNPCTIDLCEGVGCTHEAAVATPCDDGIACTQSDRCQEDGSCQGVLNCEDGDPCTIDTCVDDLCSHEENPLCSCCSEHPAHEMCEAGDTKTCVCDLDTSCCEGAWEAQCVELAGQCQGCGACGDGNCDPAETYGSCPEDCLPLCESALDCDDWIGCTEETCDGACHSDEAPMEGQGCNDWDPCTFASTCATGACIGTTLETPTCAGSCLPTFTETWDYTQQARAVAMRFLTPLDDPVTPATKGVVFVAENMGLRRFYFDGSGTPSSHYMEEAGKLLPWNSLDAPTDFLLSAHDPSLAFAVGDTGVEYLYVSAYQNPVSLGEHATLSPVKAFVESTNSGRLFIVTEMGVEVAPAVGDAFEPMSQSGEALDSVGEPLTSLVDIVVHKDLVCLLDQEAGLVLYPGTPFEATNPTGQYPTVEFFSESMGSMMLTSVVSYGDSIYILSESQGPTVTYGLTQLIIDDEGVPTLGWTVPIKQAEVTDMVAGPCQGLTFGLGEDGIGWLALPEDGDALLTAAELTTRDMDFPVQGVTQTDMCGEDGTGVAWAAMGGPGSGMVVRAYVQEAGVIDTFESVGMAARTGRATRIALYDTPSTGKTLAYVADGEGITFENSADQQFKKGLQVFNVSNSGQPVPLKRCTLGDDVGRVTDVIHDGYGHIVALVAEGESSVLAMLVPGWSGENFSPCYLQEDCKVPLYPKGFPELWMEPSAVIAFDRVEETLGEWKRWNRFVVIGEGPSVLQIADMSIHTVLPNVFNAFTLESFPEGTTGLNAITSRTDDLELIYLGTSGTSDHLLVLDVNDLWPTGPDLTPFAGQPLPPKGTLSPGSDVADARPVAMALADNDLLYVLLDDPAELSLTSSCEDADGDCQVGALWIVDVTDPTAPFEVYLGGIPGVNAVAGAYGDLGNAGDLEVVGTHLYITSHSRGLIVVDVSDTTEPAIVAERNVPGQASGLALGSDAVFIAAGRTTLSVTQTVCDDGDDPLTLGEDAGADGSVSDALDGDEDTDGDANFGPLPDADGQ